MSWEQRNADFCKAQTDAQMAYIEAEREVDRLQAENDKLREEVHYLKKGDILHVLTDQEYIDQCERERLMQVSIDALDDESAKLRELARDIWDAYRCEEVAPNVAKYWHDRMSELGVVE